MVRFGILGTARIARALFRHPLGNAAVVAVASRDRTRAEDFCAEFGVSQAYGSYDELLADPDIDAVYIPLPHHLHAEYAVKAANAGKHVLVEKPAALTTAEVTRMADAARAGGVLFMEAFMYRFLRVHNRAKEILDGGTIGTLHYIDYNLSFNVHARGLDGYRLIREEGGGALYELGFYGVDFLRFITGGDPGLVHAVMRREGGKGIDLFTHAIYTIGKTVAAFTCGFTCDANHYTLAGDLGSIHAPVALTGRYEPQVLSVHLHDGNRRYEEHFPPDMPFKWEMEFFATCIEQGKEPFLGLANTMKNVRLIEELFSRAKPLQ